MSYLEEAIKSRVVKLGSIFKRAYTKSYGDILPSTSGGLAASGGLAFYYSRNVLECLHC